MKNKDILFAIEIATSLRSRTLHSSYQNGGLTGKGQYSYALYTVKRESCLGKGAQRRIF